MNSMSATIRSIPAWYSKLANLGMSQKHLDMLEAEDEEEAQTIYREQKARQFCSPEHWIKARELRIEAGLPDRHEGKITPEDIARARAFPIKNLLKINSAGFAQCFKHTDKTPSLYCRNNFAHCFSCEWTGDTIAILMERDGLSFIESVKKLS